MTKMNLKGLFAGEAVSDKKMVTAAAHVGTGQWVERPRSRTGYWVVTLMVCLWIARAHAALIADWGFNSVTVGSTQAVNSAISPETGLQTGTATLRVTSATVTGVAGTTVNDKFGIISATSGIELNQSGVFVITIDRTGWIDIQLSYAVQKNGGSPDLTWAWSTDNSTWNTLSTIIGVGSGWSAYTNSVPIAAQGSGALYFRATIAGTGNRDVQFDNIFITAVPEPVNIALAVCGVGVLGVGMAGRIRARSREANGSSTRQTL